MTSKSKVTKARIKSLPIYKRRLPSGRWNYMVDHSKAVKPRFKTFSDKRG